MPKPSYLSIFAFASAAAILLASPGSSARADETELTADHVLVCDTSEELEAVLAATDNDLSVRLTAVNDRFGKESCNVITAIFYKGDETKTVLVPDGIVRIMKVNMVGYRAGNAWMHMAKPVAQYLGVLEKATSV